MDIFQGRALSPAGPATDIMPVTPQDDQDLPIVASALFVETGGTVRCVTVRNETRDVTLGDMMLLPVGVRRVLQTGTTALGIHALVVA
ncbi:hypothetical protein OE810_09750 [Rhodobacteraceae bacterium XHP0102]|nr:hypothetical protein [Rhodobacteraceae bacterium XHP0102]